MTVGYESQVVGDEHNVKYIKYVTQPRKMSKCSHIITKIGARKICV